MIQAEEVMEVEVSTRHLVAQSLVVLLLVVVRMTAIVHQDMEMKDPSTALVIVIAILVTHLRGKADLARSRSKKERMTLANPLTSLRHQRARRQRHRMLQLVVS